MKLEIMIDRFYYGFQWVPRASLTSSTRGCTEFHHRLKTSSNRYYDEVMDRAFVVAPHL